MGLYDDINKTLQREPRLRADCWASEVASVDPGRQIAQSGVLVFAAPGGGYLYRGQSISTFCPGDINFSTETLLFDFPQIPGTRNGAPIGNGFELWIDFGQIDPSGPALVCTVKMINAWGDWKLTEVYTNPLVNAPWTRGKVFAQVAKVAGQTADRWTVKVLPNQNVQATAYFSVGWTPGSEVPVISYGPQVNTVLVKPGLINPTK